ncbi:MAG: hypothetical protein AAGB05_12965 [Pseudomonadota bacterium]
MSLVGTRAPFGASALAGIRQVAAAIFTVLLMVPLAAQAATYAYDFELTLMAEEVSILPEDQSSARAIRTLAPSLSAPDWRDLSGFSSGDVPYGLGIDVGDTLAGTLFLSGQADFGLTLDGFSPDVDFAFVTFEDQTSGDAALAFSTASKQYDFDFVGGSGTLRTDDTGRLFAPDGSVYLYAGYTAAFSLASLSAAPERLATMPLPAGPALLLAALGGLAVLRARRRSGAA